MEPTLNYSGFFKGFMAHYTEKLLKNLFSKYDSDMTLSLISESLSCATEEDFKKLARMSQKIIPFDYMTSGIGLIGPNGVSDNFGLINVSYPEEWMALYLEKGFNKLDPLVFFNFTQFKLQVWEKTYKLCAASQKTTSYCLGFRTKERIYAWSAKS